MLKGGTRGWRQARMVSPHPTTTLLESENDQPLSKGQTPFLPSSFSEQLILC